MTIHTPRLADSVDHVLFERDRGVDDGVGPDDGSPRVIVVDDDPGLRELLTGFLVDHGLRAEAVDSGAALRNRLGQRPCDLVILDMMMPGEDGLSVLRTLTQTGDAPRVIMFSALSSEVDRVVALELGADDYVTKPSSPREILARIRSVLRRRQTQASSAADTDIAESMPDLQDRARIETVTFAGWTLNCRMRSLNAPDGTPVRLTDGEFHMLHAFVSRPQKIHSRDDMVASCGKGDSTSKGRTIDVNISRLRRKLEKHDSTEIIRTVRGNGYVFMPDTIRA